MKIEMKKQFLEDNTHLFYILILLAGTDKERDRSS